MIRFTRHDLLRSVLLGLLASAMLIAPFQISASPASSPRPGGRTPLQAASTPGPAETAAPLATASPAAMPSASAGSLPEPTPGDGSPGPAPPADPSPEPSATAPAPTPAATPAGQTPSSTATPSPGPQDAVPYVVTFGSAGAFADRGDLFLGQGALETSAIDALHVATVMVPRDGAADRVAALRMSPLVASIEPDRQRSVEAAPDDPLYPEQWALSRIGWQVAQADPPTGSAVVAVLDTGVDATHPELAGLLVPGTSFVDGSLPEVDPHGHGTWMAGLVTALTNNGQGIAGTGLDVLSVMPVTVIGPDGTGRDSDIINGVVYAVDHGADVILMAFASHGYSAALQAAVEYAWEHSVVVVAAVGNDGSSGATYPAGDAGVIGVSATQADDSAWPGNNSGAQVFLAAPGVDVRTLDRAGGYRSISGTSAAAAIVAAAAGLLRAHDETLSNGAIVGRLARTAEAFGTRDQTGNGLLDLARAWLDTDRTEVKPLGVLEGAGPYVGPYVPPAGDTPPGGTPPVYQVAAGWYSGSWAYRKAIVVDNTKVPSTLTNFPVLVNLSADSDLVANAQASGNDILFTSADGTTKISHQIETYNSSTGALVAWVEVPSLSGSVDTTIYMYYGNGSATNQQDATGVWDSNYSAVWHLANGTSLSLADSTTNARTGTNHSATATTGKIDGGASLSGASRYISVPSATLPAANNFTVSLWFKTSSRGVLFSEQNAAIGSIPGGWDPMLYVDINGRLEGGVYTGTSPGITSVGIVNNGAWHHAVLTVNFSSATQTLYLDGSSVGSWSGTPEGPFTTVTIGAGYANAWPNTPSSGTSYFNGQIDDVRVSSSATARSANWITTEWNNQNSPTTFYSVGSAETPDTTPPTITISTPAAGTSIQNGQALTASATDAQSGVASVAYRYCSGWSCAWASGTAIGSSTSSPYSVTWNSQPANGTYTIVARATDNSGNTADDTVTAVVANAASSAVGLDSTASAGGNLVTTRSWSIAVGSQANRMLLVGVTTESTSSSSSCQIASGYPTYNGTAMTKIASTVTTIASTYECAALYYLANPATGTNTVVVNFTASVDMAAGAISLYNVKQAAPDASASSFNNAAATSTSVTTIAANSWVVDVFGSGQVLGNLTSGAGQVNRVLADAGGTASTSVGMSTELKATAGAVSMSWSQTGINRSAQVVAAFAPVVDSTAPSSTLSFTEVLSPGTQHEVSTGAHAWTYYYNPSTTTTFTMGDSASDTGTGVAMVEFPGLSTTGFTGTGLADTSAPYASNTYTITNANTTGPAVQNVNVFDNAGNLTQETITFVRDTTVPSATSVLTGGPWYTTTSVPLTLTGSDAQSGLASTEVQRDSATLSNGSCGSFSGSWSNVTLSGGADATVASGNCYRYRYLATDNVGNQATSTQTADAKVDTSAPAAPSLAYSSMTNMSATGNALYYRPAAAGGFTITASSSDAQSGVAGYTFPTLPAGWTFSGSGASRSWTYTINPTTPSGSQNVSATSGAGLSSTATAFTVTADSIAPSGQTVTIGGGFYTTLSVALTLTNGSDASSGINAASGVVKRASATLSGGVCGTFGGFSTTVTLSGGADTSVASGNCYRYQYFISDNVGNQSAASASSADAKIDVNAPTAVANTYSVNEDATLNVSAPGVLGNDTDPESGALTVSLVANVTHGSLTLNSNGSFSYTPTGDFSGSDTFTYRVNDGVWNSNSATVTITVDPVNDAPLNTVPASQATAVNMAMVFSSGGGNAISITDIDAGTSAVQVQLNATNGTMSLSGTSGLSFSVGDGTADATMTFTGTTSAINAALNGLTFTPSNQFVGAATIQIVTNDQGATGSGGALSDTDSVAIDVINAAPTGVADAYSTTQGNALVVAAPGVLSNDTDPNPQTLTVQSPRPVSGPSNGSLSLNADGSFTYTPTAGFTGSDSFTYKVTDGLADSALTTVTITVNTTAYVSSSAWSSSFSSSRYLDFSFPAYVAAGSTVEGAVFRHSYRSYAGGATCYYFEVYSGATLIGTHGSSGSPVSCNSGTSFITDSVSLPEVNSASRANLVRIRLFVRNSASGKSEHSLATIGVSYWLGNP